MHRKIPLYRGRKHNASVIGYALVSKADYGALRKFRWGLVAGYPARADPHNGKRTILMHRQIMGFPDPAAFEVDHINFNRLDNRRANLRVLTKRQNRQHCQSRGGTSRFRGVSWDKARGKWFAKITVNYKQIPLGRFDSEEEAYEAVLSAEARQPT